MTLEDELFEQHPIFRSQPSTAAHAPNIVEKTLLVALLVLFLLIGGLFRYIQVTRADTLVNQDNVRAICDNQLTLYKGMNAEAEASGRVLFIEEPYCPIAED